MPREDDWFIDWVLATPMPKQARIDGIRKLVYQNHSVEPVALPVQFKRLTGSQRAELIRYPDKYIKLLEDMQ